MLRALSALLDQSVALVAARLAGPPHPALCGVPASCSAPSSSTDLDWLHGSILWNTPCNR